MFRIRHTSSLFVFMPHVLIDRLYEYYVLTQKFQIDFYPVP